MDLVKFNELPTSEPMIVEAAQRTAQALMDDGYMNPATVMVECKKVEVFLDAFKKQLKDYAINFVDDRKATSVDGAKVELRSIGRYDYATSNDLIWNNLKGQLILLEAAIKSRERTLATLKEPTTFVDDESGEVFTSTPPIKIANQSLIITLPK